MNWLKSTLNRLIPRPQLPWPSFLTFWEAQGKKKGRPWQGLWWEWERRESKQYPGSCLQVIRWASAENALDIYSLQLEESLGSLTFFRQGQEVLTTGAYSTGGQHELLKNFWMPLLREALQQSLQHLKSIASKGRLTSIKGGDGVLALEQAQLTQRLMDSEQRTLQWLKTSHHVLKQSLDQCLPSTGKWVRARFLFGQLPKAAKAKSSNVDTEQKQYQCQWQVFNVEGIIITAQSAEPWSLMVYDHGESLTPQAAAAPKLVGQCQWLQGQFIEDLEELWRQILGKL